MRAVVQRVTEASVEVEGRTVGEIGNGLLVFVGVGREDAPNGTNGVGDGAAPYGAVPNGARDGRARGAVPGAMAPGGAVASALADKVANLRIFPDSEGKANLSLLDTGGSALVISQFTLYADCRRGRRPSFSKAADPAPAETLVEEFRLALERLGITTAAGRFGAHMKVSLVNDGPYTILLDSEVLSGPRSVRRGGAGPDGAARPGSPAAPEGD
ncbi:MAG: D-tyrosyl-tRNA(Tyr) deacylase [Thermoleophilia bacterium]|nr:D-tyrosyl-tRNA(Tyr) deacylase [Thermoleophilia bacterium]